MRSVGALVLCVALLPRLVLAQASDFRVRPWHGAVARFADVTPHAVRVVNVWAPWCGPCVAELPSLEALADSLAADGIAVLTVTGDRESRVQAFLARAPLRLPILLEHDEIPVAWQVDMLPTTLLLDAEGQVLARYRGARAWATSRMASDVRGRSTRQP